MRLLLAIRRIDENIVRDDAVALTARYGGAYDEARTRGVSSRPCTKSGNRSNLQIVDD
jgi:hypothetical protein